MSAKTIAQAMREIEALFSGAWSPKKCHYPGSNFDIKKDVTTADTWARFIIQHNTGGQGSLANVNGKRMFDRDGTVFVQIFTPLNEGVIIAYDAAEIVVGAYEGKRTSSGVWFRNVRINEVNEGETVRAWQQTNVLIDFTYDQIH